MGANSNELKNTDKTSKKIERCRICGKNEMISYLNLGMFPLPNNLFNSKKDALNCNKYELNVYFCGHCGLSQLNEVVDPRVLYSYYTYKSGVSNTYKEHCKELAKICKQKYKLLTGSSGDFIVDVAGNDCTLLEEFKNEIKGIRLLNIDPAKNLCEICRNKGIPAHNTFFNINSAMDAFITYGKAQVITATNVFAHNDNVRDFILSAKLLLGFNGVLILEFPYLVDTVKNNAFGQVYFEHLSYFTLKPIIQLCEETGMKVINVEKFPIHEGTLRVVITHQESNLDVENSVQELLNLEKEEGFDNIDIYKQWKNSVNTCINNLKFTINNLKNYKIACFGASAKGNTLLNACGFNDKDIMYIIDDTPEKQNKFSPGTGIPIVSVNELVKNPPEYLLILAYNFLPEIKKRLNGIYKGNYIIPLPEVKIEYEV